MTVVSVIVKGSVRLEICFKRRADETSYSEVPGMLPDTLMLPSELSV